MDKSSSFTHKGDTQSHSSDHTGARFVEIRVKTQLNSTCSLWPEGLEIRLLKNGEMILFGPIVDQPYLMGVLNKLERLNLGLLAVSEAEN